MVGAANSINFTQHAQSAPSSRSSPVWAPESRRAAEERISTALDIHNVISMLRGAGVEIVRPIDIVDRSALSDSNISEALKKTGIVPSEGSLNAAAALYAGERDQSFELYSLALSLPIKREILDKINETVFEILKAYVETTDTLYRGYHFETKEALFAELDQLRTNGEQPRHFEGEISLSVRRLISERFAQMRTDGFSLLLELDASKIEYGPVRFGIGTHAKLSGTDMLEANLQYLCEAEVRAPRIPVDAVKGGVITFTDETGEKKEIRLGQGLRPILEQ